MAKTAALVDLVLAVVDACEELVTQGVTAAEIEEVDFSVVLRAAEAGPPEQTGPVLERQRVVLDLLRRLR
jgi:V/A-type H+-transporting ATPase subunit A